MIKVIDGDSLILEGDQSIRLASIDAPEIEYCLGKEAKERLENLVLGRRIKLDELSKDNFNRMITLVYQGNSFINKIMLEEGWGRYDSTYTSEDKILLEVANRAKELKRGVYSEKCTQIEPSNPKCPIKGNIDKHYGKKVYHFPGCSGYNVVVIEKDRGEDWFCTEEEAEKQGFVKSEQCFGKAFERF